MEKMDKSVRPHHSSDTLFWNPAQLWELYPAVFLSQQTLLVNSLSMSVKVLLQLSENKICNSDPPSG
jgi:hypothetical protein